MKQILLLAAVSVIVGGCSVEMEAINRACSLVAEAQRSAQLNLGDDAEDAEFDAVASALDRAHRAVMNLGDRDVKILVRDCDSVSGVERGTYRSVVYPAMASDLRKVELELGGRVRAVEQAREQFGREVEASCQALERAEEVEIRGAIGRLADLDRALELVEARWSEEQRATFLDLCSVDINRDWNLIRESLAAVATSERNAIDAERQEREIAEKRRAEEKAQAEAEAARRETEQMLAVLIQMEMAWNSISRSDRSTVCTMFRQDRVRTSQQWVRLSGYGKPEYAFVFLSEACR